MKAPRTPCSRVGCWMFFPRDPRGSSEAKKAACSEQQAENIQHSTSNIQHPMAAGVALLVAGALGLAPGGCHPTPRTPHLPPREGKTGTPPAEGASLPTPRSVAAGNDGDLAVLDTAGRVLIYDAAGALRRQWHMFDVKVGKPE